MNPYLTEDNQATETLEYTLDYYGISLDEFKAMTDIQITTMVKRFSDVLNDGRVLTTPQYKTEGNPAINNWTQTARSISRFNQLADSGSFSRYFDLDKWWEERIKQLPSSVQKTFPFLIVPKASKSEKNKGCEGLEKKQKVFNGQSAVSSKDIKDVEERFTTQPTHNNHPTVKPLKLMSYLIMLGSREGDLILDPYLGSGTTALACINTNRNYIGCELDKGYYEMAIKRIEEYQRRLC